VFFEEWDTPHISAIRWVSELMAIAGGDDCFAELSTESLGKNRIIADGAEIVRRNPDIIFGSWCGKKFRPENVAAREGWGSVHAVRDAQLFEIKSPDILQPGPGGFDGWRGQRCTRSLCSGWIRIWAARRLWHERALHHRQKRVHPRRPAQRQVPPRRDAGTHLAGPVWSTHRAVLIATAQPWDDEMRQRIVRHQADRALRVPGMATVEEPLALAEAIGEHSTPNTLVVVDCLTLVADQPVDATRS